MSLKDLEKIPWFAVVGAIVVLNLLLTGASGAALPSCITQALLFFALGCAFMRPHVSQGFTVFLMSGNWLLTNILVWSGAAHILSLWLLCLIQIALAYFFFTNKPLKFAAGGASWTYAAIWLVFLFGLGKLWLALSGGMVLAQIPLWGLSVLLVSFGYIVEPVEKSWALPFKLLGCLLAAVSGLTAATPLQLLP